jgi:cytosine/adenosine deaminase-related metal-dependent hydrolase
VSVAARTLLRGAAILALDEDGADLVGDVLVADDVIAATGADLCDHDHDEVIDLAGCVLIPGLHDTHRHAWQGQLRRLLPDANFADYKDMVERLGPKYGPDDVYAGTLLSALSSLDSGTTTVLDFAHNTRSPEHAQATVAAWRDSGARAVIALCPPAFGTCTGDWPGIVADAAAQVAGDPRLTVRVGLLANEIPGLDPRMFLTADKLRQAADLGVGVSVDGAFGPGAAADVVDLAHQGLLGPHVTFIHCGDLTAEAWRAIADAGATVSLAVTSDAYLGAGSSLAPIQTAIDHGVRPALGVDVECCVSGDLFAQMRATLTLQRLHQHRDAWRMGAQPATLSTREVLRFATTYGARANGLGAMTGAIRPGYQADLVAVRADDIAAMPCNSAVGTVVLAADTRSVETVLVAGRAVKRDGRLVDVDVDATRALVTASRDAVLARGGLAPDPLADCPRSLEHPRGKG